MSNFIDIYGKSHTLPLVVRTREGEFMEKQVMVNRVSATTAFKGGLILFGAISDFQQFAKANEQDKISSLIMNCGDKVEAAIPFFVDINPDEEIYDLSQLFDLLLAIYDVNDIGTVLKKVAALQAKANQTLKK
ncbi:hypothetical protein [Brevibacillus brevis]|uniref:hypothetical protein n=1 Tax=Brevibacillus brevis TaxID=1393 RepID=UPI000D0E8212|nr:hypothetical protein [Brevibacillus brevis]PSJ67446.1 hypothetical protein C7J99_20865 [Brevibacillus brevis]RED28432.1 hypothetical protein DES34_108299 [Brevibacillus brevis]GEC90686.1 hypothetical protein BBR01nite_30170 [Brevibacillus brevis]VEF91127.1 Uncharacterised protein [Brevibacillus brevis]